MQGRAPHHFMQYVYILRSKRDGKLYIGCTSDLRRRFGEHQKGQNVSTKYRAPFALVYYEAYAAREDALLREQKLKKFKNSYKHLSKRISKSLENSA
jgi:putative endonuclease